MQHTLAFIRRGRGSRGRDRKPFCSERRMSWDKLLGIGPEQESYEQEEMFFSFSLCRVIFWWRPHSINRQYFSVSCMMQTSLICTGSLRKWFVGLFNFTNKLWRGLCTQFLTKLLTNIRNLKRNSVNLVETPLTRFMHKMACRLQRCAHMWISYN